MEVSDELTGSEAIYGFCGWLTMRSERAIMSASDDAAPVLELIKRFCNAHDLSKPRDGWEKRLARKRF